MTKKREEEKLGRGGHGFELEQGLTKNVKIGCLV